MTGTGVDAAWVRFRANGDPDARAEILSQLVGLVHHTARQIAGRVGDAVGYDDLVGAGSLGLVQALGGFDPDRGVSFVTYATQRVRGAILDELRAADWRPRSVRERAKRIEVVSRELQQQLNRPPTPDEVAHALDVDRETYWQWRGDAESTAPVSIDVRVPGEERDGISLAERIADTESAPPDAEILAAERGVLLRQAIRELPEQQRTVLALSFYEELSHRQIAEVLHVTESRISQIRSAALRALKIRMADA